MMSFTFTSTSTSMRRGSFSHYVINNSKYTVGITIRPRIRRRVPSLNFRYDYSTVLVTGSSVSHFPGMTIKSLSCAVLILAALTQAHEGHSHEPASDDAAQYAQRHVRAFFTWHSPFRYEQVSILLDGNRASYVRKRIVSRSSRF